MGFPQLGGRQENTRWWDFSHSETVTTSIHSYALLMGFSPLEGSQENPPLIGFPPLGGENAILLWWDVPPLEGSCIYTLLMGFFPLESVNTHIQAYLGCPTGVETHLRSGCAPLGAPTLRRDFPLSEPSSDVPPVGFAPTWNTDTSLRATLIWTYERMNPR